MRTLLKRLPPAVATPTTKRLLAITADRLKGFDAPTVWGEFTPLANRHKSVNLGQGFPDWQAPSFAKEALCDAIRADHNQYARSAGDPDLVEALAAHYGPLVGRKIDPLTEVTVGVGASEVMYGFMQAFLNEGDEVVVLEPAFDTYPAQVQMAGGVCKYVPLELDPDPLRGWMLDMNRLERAITPRTKILLLNTPHNPTGKVLSRSELEDVAAILKRHPHVTAVTDEVYEKLVYDGNKHVHLASLPGMWERTLTVSSFGKTFSATGWKVGWCYGPANLVKPLILANQWIQYCVSTPTQKAAAMVLRESDKPYEGHQSYFDHIRSEYERKRNFLAQALSDAHLKPTMPQGGFFIIADSSAHQDIPEQFFNEPGPDGTAPVTRDYAFARYLTQIVQVTPIPPSVFYQKETKHLARNMARFAFCKTDPYLAEAKTRLLKLK